MKPFFGYHSPSFSYPGVPDDARFERLAEIVLAVEAAGFDLVTTMDHFYQIGVGGREEEPMLEVYSTLAALAARTSRVKLGRWLRASRTGIPHSSPRPSRHSTRSLEGGPSWVSERPGTSPSTSATASASRPSASGWSCSTRPFTFAS